ncbi:MAG TPA: trypsin-like peptidase domain-containing protein [Phycisphaerales bacterium]|nr:trypsin-like peptidase domain-containing protein [Phycisphaerales bacterium]
MRRFTSYGPALVVLVSAGTLLFAVPAVMHAASAARTQEQVAIARASIAADDVLERLNAATRAVADSVEPSVVHLQVMGAARRSLGQTGSGWVYDDLGHIVTNAHVVASNKRVTVQFYDGRVARGDVLAADVITDIAVIKVDTGEHIVPALRATGERLHQGERVYAFGSPFGFKFSMSEGIVSGLGRSARSGFGFSQNISNYIQTDAAVNPGNSGGPLVNIHGKVVGMNVAIATANDSEGGSQGQSAGISFAIPLATIESRVQQMIRGGELRTGFMGITFTEGEDPVYDEKGRHVGLGVAINAVQRGGPAETAGLDAGDVIVAVDGEEVSSSDVMRAIISSKAPGTKVAIRVYRDGKPMEFEVTLGAITDEARAQNYDRIMLEQYGVRVANVGDKPTVLWIARRQDSASPLKEGDVIVSVEAEAVPTAQAFLFAMDKHGAFLGRSVDVVVEYTDENGHTLRRDVTLRAGD